MTTAGQAAQVTAGIYCRISLARDGDTTKTDDQERICRDLAERHGWNVIDVYTDGSKSAWQPSRKRKEWDRMVADIEAGRINGIVVYHGDRLLRTHEDLLTLIRLARTRGIQLASPAGTRDLGDYDDQFILEIEASMAKRESANTSRRRKAQYERMRREGRTRPGGQGGRAFGFASDGLAHQPPMWCELATRLEFSEADAIREMADRVLSGESAYSVARDLTGRGVRTPSGLDITSAVVIYVLRRPRTAGLMPDGESKAAWEHVLDRDIWERVRLVLDAKGAAFSYTTSARRWLLSGIALCGACGGTLTAGYGRRNKARGMEAVAGYYCKSAGCRKVGRNAAHLDVYVSERVIARLANPLNPEGRALPVDHAAEWATLERERGETEAQARKYSKSAGRLAILMERLDEIDARMAELRELTATGGRARLLERYAGITREKWENDLALEVKRSLVAACFRVTVLPASGRGPGFRVQDVHIEPVG